MLEDSDRPTDNPLEPLDVDAMIESLELQDQLLGDIIDSAREERAQTNAWAAGEHKRITAEAEAKRVELGQTINNALEQRKKIERMLKATRPRPTRKAKA